MRFISTMTFRIMILVSILAFLFASSGPYDSDYPIPRELIDEDEPGALDHENEFDSIDAEEDSGIGTTSEGIRSVLKDSREALDVLFGSPSKSESLVVDKVLINTNYWLLDEASFAIEKELYKNGQLSEEMVWRVNEVLIAIEAEMKDWSTRPRFDATFFNQLNESKIIIDDVLGRHARNDHFSALERSFVLNMWRCDISLPSLFRVLIDVNYSNSKYTLEQAMSAVVHIDQAAETRLSASLPTDEKLSKIKLNFLMLLSQPRYRKFLEPLVCADKQDCETYKEALCNPNTFAVLAKITADLQKEIETDFPSDPANLSIILEIQKGLGEVAKNLTTIASVRNSESAYSDAKKMFVYYLGIVNVAIGYNSTDTWKKTTINNALSQFQQILIENEEYVGFTADMVLGEEQDGEQLDGATVSVQMRRVQDDSNRVEFNFGKVQIWSESISAPNKSDGNVYALYYKSWNEILRNISESFQQNETFMSNHQLIIGNGGVVSLSSRVNQKKKSVPVHYRVSIDDNQVFRNEKGEVARRCLSCGFYDVTTQDWKSDGCYVSSVDDDSVTCRCNHTTNFAAFMSPHQIEYDITDAQDLWLNVFEYVGSVTSAIGLTLSFIAFYIVRNAVRNNRLRAHMNLAAALLFVHLIQIGAEFAVYDDRLCLATTLATHYFLLASFMWMLVEGSFLYFYVVQVFVRSRSESRKWMYVVGWLAPLLVVGPSAGYGLYTGSYVNPNTKTYKSPCVDGQMLYPPIKERKYSVCWLNSLSGMTWTFVGPALAVVLLNMIILCKVVVALAKLSERSRGMGKLQGPEQQQADNNSKKELPNATPKLISVKTTNYEVQPDGKLSWRSNGPPKQPKGSLDYHQQQFFEKNPVLTFSSNRRRYLKEVKKTVKGAVVLLPLLGISWIFGLFAYKSYALSLIFVLCNAIQGVAIFLIYCVFNGEVYRALQRRICTFCLGGKNTIARRRSMSSGSVKSVLSRSMLRNWTRRSTTTPVERSNTTPAERSNNPA